MDYVLEATGYEYGANALICIRMQHPDYVKIFDTSVKKIIKIDKWFPSSQIGSEDRKSVV